MKLLLSSSWLGAGRPVSRWSLILPDFHGGGDAVPGELSDSGTWGRIPWGGSGKGLLSMWTLSLCWAPGVYSARMFFTCLLKFSVKNLPAVWETWVLSLGREDLLEKGMATHSSIFAWRIPCTEEPGGAVGSQRVGHTTE